MTQTTFRLALLLARHGGASRRRSEIRAFIQNKLWPRCKAAGISRKLFDAAFEGITEPDPRC